MSYSDCLVGDKHGCVYVESAIDDESFAILVADALRKYTDPPKNQPPMSSALQGNLCEFCVWHLGHSYWKGYTLNYAWPANADSPWRDYSDPGIDILALIRVGTNPILAIIEVKSSSGDGRNLIDSTGSSLRSDFEHLFSGNVRNRLLTRVHDIWSELAVRRGQQDLADKVMRLIGDDPQNCVDVQLIGVLVCTKGTNGFRRVRQAAFERLKSHLTIQGWQEHHIQCRCVEVGDFVGWLDEVVSRSTNASS